MARWLALTVCLTACSSAMGFSRPLGPQWRSPRAAAGPRRRAPMTPMTMINFGNPLDKLKDTFADRDAGMSVIKVQLSVGCVDRAPASLLPSLQARVERVESSHRRRCRPRCFSFPFVMLHSTVHIRCAASVPSLSGVTLMRVCRRRAAARRLGRHGERGGPRAAPRGFVAPATPPRPGLDREHGRLYLLPRGRARRVSSSSRVVVARYRSASSSSSRVVAVRSARRAAVEQQQRAASARDRGSVAARFAFRVSRSLCFPLATDAKQLHASAFAAARCRTSTDRHLAAAAAALL